LVFGVQVRDPTSTSGQLPSRFFGASILSHYYKLDLNAIHTARNCYCIVVGLVQERHFRRGKCCLPQSSTVYKSDVSCSRMDMYKCAKDSSDGYAFRCIGGRATKFSVKQRKNFVSRTFQRATLFVHLRGFTLPPLKIWNFYDVCQRYMQLWARSERLEGSV
jgi:hypothetical protein